MKQWSFRDSRMNWGASDYVPAKLIEEQLYVHSNVQDPDERIYLAVEGAIAKVLDENGMGKVFDFITDSKDWQFMIEKIVHNLDPNDFSHDD